MEHTYAEKIIRPLSEIQIPEFCVSPVGTVDLGEGSKEASGKGRKMAGEWE